MLELATGHWFDHAVHVHILRAEEEMGIANFHTQCTFLARIKLHDPAEVENKICGARVGQNRRASGSRAYAGQRLRIAGKARPDFSEKPKAIPPDARFHARQTLEDRAAIMRPGRAGILWKIQQVTVRVKHTVEAIRNIPAETRLRAHIVRNTFARNHYRTEQRPELPLPGHLGFGSVLDQGPEPVTDAKT